MCYYNQLLFWEGIQISSLDSPCGGPGIEIFFLRTLLQPLVIGKDTTKRDLCYETTLSTGPKIA